VFAAIARWAILLFAIFMALSQLRIAPAIVELLFSAIVFGSALAFGLAFGLGGRDAAQRLIESGEANMNNAAVQLSTRQTTGQMDTTTRQTIPQDVRNMPQGTQNVAQDVRQQAQQTGSDVQQKAQDLP
jgi:hypothetical protein